MRVRDARLPVALAIETLWSFAAAALFVRLLSNGDGPAPSLAAAAAVVLGSFVLARLIAAARLASTQARVAAAVVSAISLFLILHVEYAGSEPPWRLAWFGRLMTEPHEVLAGHRYVVAGAVAATLVWLRGVRHWTVPVARADALRVGVLGLAAVSLAAIVDPPAHGPHAFGTIALAFFILAWLLLALCQTADADEALAMFTARWIGAFSVIIAASLAFTLIVVAFDARSLGFVRPAGATLLDAAGTVAAVVLAPVVAAIEFLFHLLPLHSSSQHPAVQPAAPPRPPHSSHTPAWAQIVERVLAGGGIAVLVLAFVAAMWIAMSRYGRRKTDVAEQRRIAERGNTLSEDLGTLLDSIARRFRRTGATPSSIAIRRLYHEMLARAEADGLPRPLSATPLQFASQLDARYHSKVPSAISRAFITSRYGLAEVDIDTVSEFRARWRSLLRSGSS